VHQDFRAIFTSNPEDYAGVHKTQNALLDRMITIELDYCDRETEVAITQARAGVDEAAAAKIVDLVRRIRTEASSQKPTLRASVMIARIMRQLGGAGSLDDQVFLDACLDVLHSTAIPGREASRTAAGGVIRRAIEALA
jgi:gas vesicle protein GvpN